MAFIAAIAPSYIALSDRNSPPLYTPVVPLGADLRYPHATMADSPVVRPSNPTRIPSNKEPGTLLCFLACMFLHVGLSVMAGGARVKIAATLATFAHHEPTEIKTVATLATSARAGPHSQGGFEDKQ